MKRVYVLVVSLLMGEADRPQNHATFITTHAHFLVGGNYTQWLIWESIQWHIIIRVPCAQGCFRFRENLSPFLP